MSVTVSNEKKMRKEDTDTDQSMKKMSASHCDESDDDSIVVLPYDVIQMIFKELAGRDLSNCAMVCRLWSDVAVSELANRGPVTKFVVWDEVFKKCYSSKHFPHDLTNRPMLGVLFNGTNQVPPDCLGKHLPKHCITLVIGTYGVVFNNQEYERCPKNAAYGFLPDDPEVEMEFIMGNKNEVIHFDRNLEVRNNGAQPHRLSVIEPMFQDAVNRLKGVKGMLLITTEQFRHEDKLSGMNVIKNHVPMLWGGVSKKLVVCKRDNGVSKTDQMLWMAVLIGGQNVRCWSVILEPTDHSKSYMRERLTAMRRELQLLKRTIGLMFACVGRGEAMHHEKHVEATMFREVFPEIPLIGGFGNGEYGFSFDDKTTQNKIAHYQYCTVFMILTYG